MDERVGKLARRYVWWSPPEGALADRDRFLAQVMAFGSWEDAHWLLRHLGKDAFIQVLRSPPPGILSPKAWHFWHRRLLNQAPPTLTPPGRHLPTLSADGPAPEGGR